MYIGNSKKSYSILPILSKLEPPLIGFIYSSAVHFGPFIFPHPHTAHTSTTYTSTIQIASQGTMAQNTLAQNTSACRPPRLLLGLLGGLACGSTLGYPLGDSSAAIAQVNNADLACYLNAEDGIQYDLSALCSGFEVAAPTAARSQEVVLQTGDVQVTLRWDGDADLDLFVQGPSGEEVSFLNPAIASGGQLDVDANAGCFERMAAPVENIFWPTGGGVTGDYMVTVNLFSSCTTEGPVDFSLDILTHGTVETYTGTVSTEQSSARFPFALSALEAMPVIEGEAGGLPAVPGL